MAGPLDPCQRSTRFGLGEHLLECSSQQTVAEQQQGRTVSHEQAVDHADPRSIVDGVVVHGTSVSLQAAVVVPGKFNVKVRSDCGVGARDAG